MSAEEWCRDCKHHRTFHNYRGCTGNSLEDPNMDYWGITPSCMCATFNPDNDEGYTP